MKTERFFLSQDGSSHWYVIPVNKANEWDNFLNIDEEDPLSWKVPDYAIRVGGSCENVTFEKPSIQ